jgi:ATP-dependent Clp protease, protease subunit
MKWFGLAAASALFSATVGFCMGASLHATPAPTMDSDSSSYATLYGEVNEQSVDLVIAQIHQLNQQKTNEPIVLLIDSPGGDVMEGMKLVDAIAASHRPVDTVDVGLAASMAAYIFEYGRHRSVFPHATLMFHNASSNNDGELNHQDSELRYFEAVVATLQQETCSRTGISLSELQEKEAAEWWVLPKEAIDRHFADSIINPAQFPVNGQ